MPRLLQIAMQTSLSRGGVSVLVLPGDVAAAKMTSKELEHPVFRPRPSSQPSSGDLRKLADFLNKADRVTLFGGAGCAVAQEEVLGLPECPPSADCLQFSRERIPRERKSLCRWNDRIVRD